MLPPICEKLGIDIPELYLTLDVSPNAYTFGDNSPFIVVTSGLFETLPEELIPSVLAHECGHIACHHCLYTTMGNMILSNFIGFFNFLGLTNLISYPIMSAFYHWMRCSEFSADRAAAICDGSSDKVVETCMRFAGFDKDINANGNVEEFMSQATDYLDMVKNSKFNKTLEFLSIYHTTHPLNAVRAYECNEWTKTDRFKKITTFINNSKTSSSITDYLQEIPMPESSKYYIGKDVSEVNSIISELGFVNINTVKITKKNLGYKNGNVINIRINNSDGFNICEWYPSNSKVTIEYYEQETEEEVTAAHPGQLRMPNSSKYYFGRTYTDAVEDLLKTGFIQIKTEEQHKKKKGLLSKNKGIAIISVNGQTQFDKGEWFDMNSEINIIYYTYTENSKK